MAQGKWRCWLLEMIKEIIKKIEQLSGKYSGYEIFADWVKAMAIAISNAMEMTNSEIYQKEKGSIWRLQRNMEKICISFQKCF